MGLIEGVWSRGVGGPSRTAFLVVGMVRGLSYDVCAVNVGLPFLVTWEAGANGIIPPNGSLRPFLPQLAFTWYLKPS